MRKYPQNTKLRSSLPAVASISCYVFFDLILPTRYSSSNGIARLNTDKRIGDRYLAGTWLTRFMYGVVRSPILSVLSMKSSDMKFSEFPFVKVKPMKENVCGSCHIIHAISTDDVRVSQLRIEISTSNGHEPSSIEVMLK